MDARENADAYLSAIRLLNREDGSCIFQQGKIPTDMHISARYFFAQKHIDDYQKVAHPAPRLQYVVTLKGILRFKVTNGETFIIEPGVILIAEDTEGPGHTWELIEGDKWERLYIAFESAADDHFIADAH